MQEKETNLAVAADVNTKAQLLALADAVGPEICMLKMHVDIIEDFDEDLIVQLQNLARKHNFLIVEDRKFADIGNTVQLQYTGGMYRIIEWADIIIAHAIAGPDCIKALAHAAYQQDRGLLLITQMSSAGNLIDQTYTQRAVEIARAYDDFVVGFIAQQADTTQDSPFIVCTPGVHSQSNGDALGQNYLAPEYVIKERGSDIIIVGRAICQSPDPQSAARAYRMQAWCAYHERITKQLTKKNHNNELKIS